MTIESPNAFNPWKQSHVDAEMACGSSARTAKRVVDSEYADAPAPRPCALGGFTWWRATVGAFVCPDCGQIERLNGDVCRKGKATS